MLNNEPVASYFDRKAHLFDGIYTGRKNFFGRIWDKLTRQNMYFRFEFTIRAISPLKGKRVLDVGCGSGRYCVEMAERGAAEVVGIELSEKMLEIARSLAKRSGRDSQCRFFRVDIMDFREQKPFDEVIAVGFFDYAQKPAQVLAHIQPLVRHRLIASFPTLWALRVPFRKIWLVLHGCPVHFFMKSKIYELCRKTGFVCKMLVRTGPIYLLIAEPDLDSNIRSESNPVL